ncbi:hypothetical protein [Jeotgalibaca porci]|uniref:hypothetical protein n=1 Tax=Jeotgalibaca porci TaxID=1868793 RepID=UPI0035A0F9C7
MSRKILIAFCAILFFTSNLAMAQFTITNSLRTNDTDGLRIGDNATLTAATGVDPNGSGWLRLTNSTGNQKGFMYVATPFGTGLGVTADFEYLTWRNTADTTYHGADGFSVYLFNGTVTDANFRLGGYGGSLGYATFSNPVTAGLTGGYVGIGFDEYGNYSVASEGRNGGTNAASPNAVVLRGPTALTNSNPYLTRTELGSREGTANDIRARNEIDYNTATTTRPAPDFFYRRFQIYVTKTGADYLVTVRWRKQNETTFTNILSYTMNGTTYPLPASLKLGFVASTGGGYNFHEIRNILLTTPGNIRVDSRSDTALLCNDTGSTEVTFKIEVTNDTAATLNSIDVTNQIQDAVGNLLDPAKFKITSLSTTGFTSSTLPTATFPTNSVTGKVGLAPNTSGIITIKGNYFKRSIPTNQNFKSVSTVNTNEVTDIDTTNNSATTIINVRKCNILTNPSMPSYNK